MINYTLPIEYDNSFLKDNFDKLVVGAIYDSSTETLTIGGKYANGFIR